MDIKTLELLIDRYFQGLTTVEEELQLKEYFASEKVPPHLEYLKTYFSILGTAVRSGSKILTSEEDVITGIRRKRSWFRFLRIPWSGLSAVAATLILFVMVGGVITYRMFQPSRPNFTTEEVQAAIVQTREVLGFVSERLNFAMEPLDHLAKMDYVLETLQPISILDKNLHQSIPENQ